MMQPNGPAALLWYVYRTMGQSDGGFSVTVYENDTLVFTVFGPMGQVMQQLTFPLPPQVQDGVLHLLDVAAAWPTPMPGHVQTDHPPAYACMLGLAGLGKYVVDELADLMHIPFGSRTGYWARRIFLLMEDLSQLLATCGFYLEPDRFQWDTQTVIPLDPY